MEKFYNCPLPEIAIPYNSNGVYGEVYKKFESEVKREFGSNSSYSLMEFGNNLTLDMLKRWYMPNDTKLQEIISYLGDNHTFQSVAHLIQECKTFNEASYRKALENQYGKVRGDEISSKLEKSKKTCEYLTSANTPLSSAKYYIEWYQKWYLKKYVNNK